MYHIRQETMKAFIEANNAVTIRQLQALYPNVSLMTIHRDLDVLEQRGVIVKYRGGARAVRHLGDPEFNERMHANTAGKNIIAGKALELIRPNAAIFLDASTTNLAIAKQMPDMNIHVFTTGPSIALELCRLHEPIVNLCCGTMNRKNLAVSGQNTLEMLDKINIDIAFIGVSGCSVEAGFTCGTESDMLVKRLVIQKARTSVAVCGKDKLSRLMPYTFATFSDVDYLISDDPLPEPILRAAEEAGLRVL